jgi:hypothetical protein
MCPDVVVWDSHPLALGATPKQVWIDGIPQIDLPFSTQKPPSFQKPPVTPDFDREAYEAIKYDGLPPLQMRRPKSNVVIFINVTSLFVRRQGDIHEVYSDTSFALSRTVVVENGVIVCDGSESSCQKNYDGVDAEWVNLEGGSLSCAVFLGLRCLRLICLKSRSDLVRITSCTGGYSRRALNS